MGLNLENNEFINCVLECPGETVQIKSIKFTSEAVAKIADIMDRGIKKLNQQLKTETIILSPNAYRNLKQKSYNLYAEGYGYYNNCRCSETFLLENIEIDRIQENNFNTNANGDIEIYGANIIAYKFAKHSYYVEKESTN